MRIGVLRIDIYIYGSSSLKGKRRVVKSLKERIRNRFNVSVAEVDNHDKWQRVSIGIACLGTDKSSINGLLDKVLNFIRDIRQVELGNYEIELL